MNADAELVYIDHNVIVREPFERLRSLSTFTTRSRFAYSLWNIVEIAKASDKAQAIERVAFMESTDPLWLITTHDLETLEIAWFLGRHYYGIAKPRPVGWRSSFNRVMVPIDTIADVKYTAAHFLKYYHAFPDQLAILLGHDTQTKQALGTLQEVRSSDRAAVVRAEEGVFAKTMHSRLPLLDGLGQPMLGSQKPDIIDFLWTNRSLLYRECKTIALAHQLYLARTNNPNRKPTDADGRDLQHMQVALSVCDHFVTSDGYVRSCADYAAKHLPQHELATVHKNWSEYLAAVHTK